MIGSISIAGTKKAQNSTAGRRAKPTTARPALIGALSVRAAGSPKRARAARCRRPAA